MLLAHRTWTELAIAFGAWLAIQAIEGFFLQPILLGRPLGLRALPVFLALLTGSFLFGPMALSWQGRCWAWRRSTDTGIPRSETKKSRSPGAHRRQRLFAVLDVLT